MGIQSISPQKTTVRPGWVTGASGAGRKAVSMPAVPVAFTRGAVQLKGGVEEHLQQKQPLQLKSNTLQKVAGEEEEPLQMKPFQLKSDILQKKTAHEEEEPLQMKVAPFQLKGPEEEDALQMKTAPFQLKGSEEEEEPLQMKPLQLAADKPAAKTNTRPNQTGMPDNLKAGVEALSGIAMDDVKVHYNSAKPAQLNALAYAQGTDIHIAPGQEKHLPHEAWHVVQQKQGRVRPTMQMKEGVAVNDDKGLEKEADVMGGRALQENRVSVDFAYGKQEPYHHSIKAEGVAQRMVLNLDTGDVGITADADTAKRRQERDLNRTVHALDDTWSPVKKQLMEPLKMLAKDNPNEPLTILAHGLPAIGDDEPQVAGKTAQQLYNELLSFGLTPAFTGIIDLSNCTTAWSRDGQKSFAERFYDILRSNGHKNVVTGFRSFVSSPDIDTETEIDYKQRERALVEFIITRYINELNVFTIDDSTPEEKVTAAAKLNAGNTLVFQEVRKLLIGAHDDTYQDIWVGLWKILGEIVKRRDRLTQSQALNYQVELMDLKRKAGTGGGAIKTVPAKKVEFKDKEPDIRMLMMVIEHVTDELV